jgi:hypothetical protein
MHFWRYCGPLSHEFHHQHFFPVLPQKTVAINFLANVCLNFFGLFGECVCIHWFDCSSVSTFTNETQVSSHVTRTMWLRNCHLCGIALKSQSRSHSLRFVRTHEFFRNPSCAKLVIVWHNCDNLVEKSAWVLWKFTRKFWNCEAPSFTLNNLITHYRWRTTSLFIVNIYSPASLWTFYTNVLQFFTHYILAVNRA